MQKEVGSNQYEVLANRVRNVADRYRTQQRFWNALSWYQRLVEQSFTGVFIIQDGEFIYVNQRFADILGYCQSEMIGSSPFVIASDSEDEAVLQDFMERKTAPDESFKDTFTAKRQNGEEIPVEVYGGTIQHRGKPGTIGLLWDRTIEES